MRRQDLFWLIVANVCATVIATLIINFIYKNAKSAKNE